MTKQVGRWRWRLIFALTVFNVALLLLHPLIGGRRIQQERAIRARETHQSFVAGYRQGYADALADRPQRFADEPVD